jgi:acetate kinase
VDGRPGRNHRAARPRERVRVLVVNAGSSSLKLSLLDDDADDVVASETLAAGADPSPVLERLGQADAVGHRVVHGGERFSAPVLIDDSVQTALRELADLAPLHQPKSLDALDAVSAALPRVPAVACFDTAFHATLPPAAATYALPRAWRERWPLRRYGFHGLSHAYASRRAAELTGGRRLVICHLGAGASVAAVADGRSVDTTMGFTPLEGLVMATRSGDVDPGLLLWLEERQGMSPRAMSEALERESGLLGLAGSADMRDIVRRARERDAEAQLALDVYLHRLRAKIAAMAPALGGLDTLVFTGGVGEHAPAVRRGAADGLGFLGVALDAAANEAATADAEIGAMAAPVRTLVVTAREDLEIARQVRAVLSEDP